jgi:hypothetical protein
MPRSAEQLRSQEKSVAILDRALDAAEAILRPLLKSASTPAIVIAFRQHVTDHLGPELANIVHHGHKNDDPADRPRRAKKAVSDGRISLPKGKTTNERAKENVTFKRCEDSCDCAERSWYGPEHDSACSLAGMPRGANHD